MEDVVWFDNDEYELMREHLSRAYPCEGCGALLGYKDTRRINMVRPARNTLSGISAAEGYRIDAGQLRQIENEAETAGMDLLGFYHSHPDKPAICSDEDIKHAVPGLIYVIVSVDEKGCTETAGYIRMLPDKSGQDTCTKAVRPVIIIGGQK
ncbi:MAG: M67 family metallopeptidase [Lachnospiraceae bacterium]|nr:M67 family metallopeptidase [Lachnospiraceae bacterium]